MNALRNWRKSLPDGHRSQSAVGKMLGVSAAEVSRWESGRRQVPAERVIEFEKITGIPRHKLRPDVFDTPVWDKAAE
jgi:DNA-binding transcriptional regulator YdaS (Cro superfamily)